MKIGLSLLDQIRGGAKDAFGFVAESFDQIIAQLQASYHKEHTVDDGHSTIHATGPVYERSRTPAMGVWITAPYSASYFVATSGSTWTVTAGQLFAFQYTLVGSSLTVAFYVESSTLATATATTLFITIPGGFTAVRRTAGTFNYDDNGTKGVGTVSVRAASTAPNSGVSLELTKDIRASTSWSVSSSLTVFGEMTFEILTSDAAIPSSNVLVASGGTITTAGTRTIHTFTTNGTFIVSQGSSPMDYLIIGGGGGGGTGGSGGNQAGGGGGAGDLRTGTDTITAGSYAIVIGTGGAGGVNTSSVGSTGVSSSFNSHTVAGGGGGSGGAAGTPTTGGSGGGAGDDSGSAMTGATGTGTTVHSGGNNGTSGGSGGSGGGGGGSGTNGAAGVASGTARPAGGTGTANSISGASVTYAAGGAGGSYNANAAGANGTANTGNGGGGGDGGGATNTGGTGGSGIVIISYLTP